MENKVKGIVILESLEDQSIPKSWEILESKLDGNWNILTVEVTLAQMNALSSQLKEGKWYAHFWHGEELIVVFKDKMIFDRKEAIEYGRSLGIPEEQLDFPID